MSKESIRKFRKIYSICMAAYSGVVGLLFIIQVWSIFLASPNGNPYTRESIAAAFSKIAVFVWLWVAAAIFGAFIPKAEPIKPKAYLSSQLQIERLRKRVVLSEEIAGKIKPLKITRIVLFFVQVVVWITVFIFGVVLLTMENYQPIYQREYPYLVERLLLLLAVLFFGVVVSVVSMLVTEFTRKKEIVVLKEELISKAKTAEKIVETKEAKVCFIKRAYNAVSTFLQKPTVVLITRIALGVIGVVFVVFGIFNGGMADVLEKAVMICTQCIGLG